MIKLSFLMDLVEQISSDVDQLSEVYIHIKNNELIWVSTDMISSDELDMYEDESIYRWVDLRIPTYEIVNSYMNTIEDSSIREAMRLTFQGRGKYQRIKHFMITNGIIEKYYHFKDVYIKDKVLAWCKQNNILVVE